MDTEKRSIDENADRIAKAKRLISRYKFIPLSLLFFLLVFLVVKSGIVVRNPDNDYQRAAKSDIQTSRKYMDDVRLQLYQKQFDLLDKTADELRASKERLPGGPWKLYRFYMGISDVGEAGEAEWKTLLDKLEQWIDERPNSITARTALGHAYTGYAWKARGRGYASTVSEEQFRLFRERLEKADQILNEAAKLPQRCPNWYYAMQKVALGQGWETDRYNKLFEEAVKLEPLYHYYYANKATFLMPRWHGAEGDWERFADETYEKMGGKEGSTLYSYIALEMSGYNSDDEPFFTSTKVSWPKMKQGLIDKEALYGTTNYSLNQFCFLACLAEDRPTAQELFARIGEDYDPYAWGQGKKFYRYRAWASDRLIDKLINIFSD